MKVVAVNLGTQQEVEWRGKKVQTGIYKYPIAGAIALGEFDVERDAVVDRKYHGGTDKCCYIYSAKHYDFWKQKYPNADWDYGMFGENVTVEDLDEANVQIGDIFYLGSARVQVTEPRQPCFKLGIRFGTQKVVKDYINNPYPGIYVKLIEPGEVKAGDEMHLSERLHNSIGLLDIWDLLYAKQPNLEDMEFALDFQHLAEACKSSLRKRVK